MFLGQRTGFVIDILYIGQIGNTSLHELVRREAETRSYSVGSVCITSNGNVGGCFSTCDDAEELDGYLSVQQSDRKRARKCHHRQICCPLPLARFENRLDHLDSVDPTQLNEADCGREFSRRFRIINGVQAVEGAHPWLVAIFSNNYFVCGGALITNRYVLTAAHCFNPESQKFPLNLRSFFAIGGTNALTDEAKRITRRLCRVAIHKNYKPENFYNDIAIAELNEPVDVSGKWVRTICLPPVTDRAEDINNKKFTIAGWGSTQRDITNLTMQLLEIRVTGGSNSACKDQFKDYILINTNIQMCAGDIEKNVKDACQGDSGGPLIRLAQDGRYRVEGVTSFGVGCAVKGMPFGGYARVSVYSSWIEKIINSMKTSAKTCDYTLSSHGSEQNKVITTP
ncbi:proclotting enzyme-like isoform X2 [Varroa destructor]|uniref:Peptidase S1 domain-containing protein n=1 Tax=Varroa destructor TaxID=109461 RepID=A0A7M7JXG0_VARDE|nr:proclotting enzyme-like isoform X2 [Varroa destructor]